MSDAKDADVDRLTREDYKAMWELSERRLATSEELRTGLALKLQSLSQEAVRDEALEEAARVCGNTEKELRISVEKATDEKELLKLGGAVSSVIRVANAIRALKREPNAAAEPQG